MTHSRLVKLTSAIPRALQAGLLLSCLAPCGCSENRAADQIAAANDSNIKRVANLYQSFLSRNGWEGPRDEATFRKFIQETPPHRLEMMQVDPNALDDLFRSERDGQPFQVRYEVKAGLGSVTAIVFEHQGEDGRRQVAFTNGSVEEADEARCKALLEGGGQSSGNPGRQATDGGSTAAGPQS
jgi:hypothetical protein